VGAIVRHAIELFAYRDLLYTLTLHRFSVRYKQSLLGPAWAVVQPLSLMAIYTIIFSLFTRIPTNGLPYAVFVYSALLLWTFFSTAVTTSANSLVSHTQLISKVYFPREILPITYVNAALVDLLIASLILGCLMAYYRVHVTSNLLYVIPIVLLAVVFTTAASLLVAAIQVRFRDIGLAMPLLLQLWMFASPVVYPLSAVPPRFKAVYLLNPMAGIIEDFRRALLQGAAPEPGTLRNAIIISCIALPLAYAWFKNREATMVDVI